MGLSVGSALRPERPRGLTSLLLTSLLLTSLLLTLTSLLPLPLCLWAAPFIPSGHVAFADEMGYTLWKWALLSLTFAFAGLAAMLVIHPPLLGGEQVMGSTTVVEAGGAHLVDNRLRGGSMY